MATTDASSSGDKIFTPEVIAIALKSLGLVFSVLPSLVGVGLGLAEGSIGVSKAADYTINITNVIFPMAFISAPAIYSVIIFFVIVTKKDIDLPRGIGFLSSGVLYGFAGGFSGYVLGLMCKSSLVTLAQQKKFTTSYFLIMIFGEVIGLLALVSSIALIPKDGDKK